MVSSRFARLAQSNPSRQPPLEPSFVTLLRSLITRQNLRPFQLSTCLHSCGTSNPTPKPLCEVVVSTDGASAHTAHCLSITQMSCVLTTIYCKCSVAIGACPTESMEVAETKSDSTHGVPNVLRHRTQNQHRLQHWIGEHNNQ